MKLLHLIALAGIAAACMFPPTDAGAAEAPAPEGSGTDDAASAGTTIENNGGTVNVGGEPEPEADGADEDVSDEDVSDDDGGDDESDDDGEG